jgi:gluconokinase
MRRDPEPVSALIIMGVSGSGKTTVGKRLADHLGWTFIEGDDYHPQANQDKMARGEALNDEDRKPWLAALHDRLAAVTERHGKAVLTSSALKRAYRNRLSEGLSGIKVVYLKGDFPLVKARMDARRDHYMKSGMLAGQFQALEEPEDALIVDASKDVESIVRFIASALGLAKA